MLKSNACMTIAGVAIAAGLSSTADAQKVVEVREVYIERPPGTVAIVERVNVASDAIQMFRNSDFDDEGVLMNVSARPAGQANELPGGMEDSLSSLRWSLPAGVLVVFYEDAGAKGEQFPIWGRGQVDRLSTFDFNDKASRWAWYYVGGAIDPSEVVLGGELLPVGAVTGTAPTGADTMQLFKSSNFEGNEVTISPTAQAANALQRLPKDLPDSLTSMRWNLPPGVVVIFHQDAQGDKQQIPIWGSGQVTHLDIWDFNDKASRWAWHYIGSPEVEVLGYVPPEPVVEPTVVITPGVVEPAPAPPKVVVVEKDAIGMVAGGLKPIELRVEAKDLVATKNPVGEGTFVYVPRTNFNGVECHVVWLVLDDKAYALTGPAKLVTPSLATPTDMTESAWAKTGINRLNAEPEAVRIVFVEK